MNSYKFLIEVGQYEGSAWTSRTDNVFRTVVQAPNPQMAQRMLEAQYGGPDRVKVKYQGPA